MNILVTGGAGFIGSNFIYYMLKEHSEYKIVSVDCLTYAGNMSTLEEAMKSPKFIFIRKISVIERIYTKFLKKNIQTL